MKTLRDYTIDFTIEIRATPGGPVIASQTIRLDHEGNEAVGGFFRRARTVFVYLLNRIGLSP